MMRTTHAYKQACVSMYEYRTYLHMTLCTKVVDLVGANARDDCSQVRRVTQITVVKFQCCNEQPFRVSRNSIPFVLPNA